MRSNYSKVYLILSLVLNYVCVTSAIAQVRVGLPFGSLDGSASLDVRPGPYPFGSPFRGLLAPSMSTSERNQIQNPATGLFLYNNSNKQIEVNVGTSNNPVWAPAVGSGSAWSTTGNSGTVDKVNFIGTGDNAPLNFRVFNQPAGRIDHILYNLGLGFFSINPNTTGTYNTSVGSYTLRNNTTGIANTAVGAGALTTNTSGTANTGIGHDALIANVSGRENTAVGQSALRSNTTGYSNTALGADALNDAVNGYDNTGLGASALYSNTSGYSNSASGALALRFNTTGHSNTAVGNYALQHNNSGNFNTSAGFNAGPSQGNNTINNSTALGANAVVNASNTIVLGDAGIISLRCNVQTISTLSDRRIKEDIKNDVPGLNFITKLSPVTYRVNKYKEAKLLGYSSSSIEIDNRIHSGFVAQEVEKAAQEVGYDFEGVRKEDNGRYYTVGYTLFVIPLVQAVKDLNGEIESLKRKLDDSVRNNAELKGQVQDIKKLLTSLNKNIGNNLDK